MNAALRSILALCLIASVAVSPPMATAAEDIKLSSQGPGAIKLNLEKLVGKKVTLRIIAGEDISGTVESVGVDAVVITQLTGKEFFDAAVALHTIAAVTVRAR